MEHEANVGHTTTIVCAVFQGLATLFVGARLFTRVKLLEKLYIDDWIIIISLVRSHESLSPYADSKNFVYLYQC